MLLKYHRLALLAPINVLVSSKEQASSSRSRARVPRNRCGSSLLLPGSHFLHCHKELFSFASSNNPATQLFLILELVDASRRNTQNFRRLCYATGFDKSFAFTFCSHSRRARLITGRCFLTSGLVPRFERVERRFVFMPLRPDYIHSSPLPPNTSP